MAADHHLLFGLLALQTGLIDQAALFAAFHAWTQHKARTLADQLVALGYLDAAHRPLLEGLAAAHIARHDGDVEKSLAAISAGRSTRESLARLADADVAASLGRLDRVSSDAGDDFDRTASYSVGTASSDGVRFRVLRPHARGGLGTVFVALDTELHREVALKQILDHHADDPVSRQRFLVEAEITGSLEHPGIVPVYGLGTYADGRPFYAMRFIRGDSLKEAIDAFHRRTDTKSPSPQRGEGARTAGEPAAGEPPSGYGRVGGAASREFQLRRLLGRFVDVCNAIEYAHSRGVLHRDIKPGNIIVGKHGETLVVDWGLAKATGRSEPGTGERTLVPSSVSGSAETLPGSALGTPAYMSPEQAAGDLGALGPRSDVYGLGATLYYLLTGKPPYEGDDAGELLRRVQRGDFVRPRQLDSSIDPPLEAVCSQAMATKPEDRYRSCRQLAEEVERWMADEPVVAWREPVSRRVQRWARRNRPLVTAAVVAVFVALGGLGAVLAVQRGANRVLAARNADLDRANINLQEAVRQKEAANVALGEANERVQARFELAREAIRSFKEGVEQEEALKENRLRPLRDKLLGSARRFYDRLADLLKGQTDADSRAVLAESYTELGELDRDRIWPGFRRPWRPSKGGGDPPRAGRPAGSRARSEQVKLADALNPFGEELAHLGDHASSLADVHTEVSSQPWPSRWPPGPA